VLVLGLGLALVLEGGVFFGTPGQN